MTLRSHLAALAVLGALTALVGLSGPAFAQAKPATPPAAAAPAKPMEPMDLNAATKQQLMTLDGIGEARSDAIIKGRPYRAKHELVDKGILPQGVYDKIKDQIIAKQVAQAPAKPAAAAPAAAAPKKN